MNKILHINASPRNERSISANAAKEFLKQYQKVNPKDQIKTLDLFTAEIPDFDGFTINAKYAIMHNQEHTEQEKSAWQTIEKIISEFKSADKYVFSIPMWNFGIPYRLKHYIDIIVQPTYTFGFDEQTKGYTGLLRDKKALVFFSRGGDYSDPKVEVKIDHQKSYFVQILGFIGINHIKTFTIEPTMAGGEQTAKENLKKAIDESVGIIEDF